MKRQFGLPAAFALTLLAFLFFGFAKVHRVSLVSPDKVIAVACDLSPTLPPDTVDESEPATSSPSSTSLPTQPEPFAPVDDGTIAFEPLPRSPVEMQAIPSLLPLDSSVLHPGDGGPGVSLPGSPVDASGLDNPPRATVQTPPAYPPNARASGLAGEVWVEFAVDEAGHVLRTRVVRSSDPMFDEPTLRAVAKWRFEPGRKNGRPVAFRMVVPVNYHLSN